MKKNAIDVGLQALLGLAFLVFGLNKIFNFLPPPELSEQAGEFFGALIATGYMVKLIAITEIGTGILLLARRFSALALVLLAPLTLNIVLFHLILDPVGGVPGYVLGAIHVYLLFTYLPRYKSMLSAQ
jgi:uncharacterized membrane protein YphA (DoxX/SURF4 family)